ncbi:alpha/beta hydrolase family protein [Nonomuraea jabiensis]|uniref:Dienelactone hydrolase n=1 Tax=Nonomuraea jabiensis TaxID=882448 RepID=A0A7W9LB59_9ACTN|nr:alpha/beta hydrolase [Nonomuraea jabiensis]MBB5777311.1 dienelactone hydrolase [Nonomuraea jabiensis]
MPEDLAAAEVSFQGSGGLVLHGSVISPAGARARSGRAGVVLVHGAGTGTKRDKLLGEAVAFARQGLSVLIYDKRSEGYSLFERSYSQLADDALGAVRTLRRQPGIDPAKVGIWGLSEGGWVAPLAASRSKDISFVILVGANALQPLRQQTWAVAAGLRKAGVRGSFVDRTEPTMYRAIADAGMFPEPYYDPEPVIASVRQPVLGIWGVHDLLTPPRETPPIFAKALEKGGNRQYTFRFFADADHAAHRTPDGGVTRLPELAPGYAELVGSWVGEATSGRAPVAQVTGPAPVQAEDTVAVPAAEWWEAAGVQGAALVLFLVAFGGYPVVALIRRVRRRGGVSSAVGRAGQGEAAPVKGAWLVSAGGLTVVVGAFVYLFYSIMTGGKLASPGPLVAGRPLIWLALQALAIATVVGTVLTCVRWRRSAPVGERVRVGLLVAGGVVFVPWALYWGLLLP